jgi:hypothetical protein
LCYVLGSKIYIKICNLVDNRYIYIDIQTNIQTYLELYLSLNLKTDSKKTLKIIRQMYLPRIGKDTFISINIHLTSLVDKGNTVKHFLNSKEMEKTPRIRRLCECSTMTVNEIHCDTTLMIQIILFCFSMDLHNYPYLLMDHKQT